MKVIFTNPTNNTFARMAALGLERANLLSEYYTTISVFPKSILDRMGGISFLSEIRRRRFDPKLKPYVNNSPWLEIGRQISFKANFKNLIKHETGVFNIDSISKSLDRKVASNLKSAAKKGVSGVYSYEDIAAFSFREAKKHGVKCLYDQPIGYWRTAHKLLEIERKAWPDWANTLIGFSDSEYKLDRKDEELRLADAIFVASTFTKNTLKDFPGELAPVHLIPYGFPPVSNENRSYTHLKKGRPLKLIFVGSLSQRKGIANLFSAVDDLEGKVSLTVIGHKAGENCPALDEALARHEWFPTLPHDKVLEKMRESDVLIFPSLFEGFGLVITEAMSQGTPVITTERTAGPDIMTHGENGWIVKAGDTAGLKAQIEELIEKPELIEKNGKAAMLAAKNWTWDDYGRELAKKINEVIN